MPGVVVTTGVRTGPATAPVAPASTFFLCGTAERGPVTEAKLVTSQTEFETYYGDYNASFTLHQHAKTYFEEGGTRAYISRVTGSSAQAAATLTLATSAPANALTITAANTGAWGNSLKAQVVPGTGSFNLKILYQDELVYSTGFVATAQAAADKINNSTTAGIYVTATVISANAVLAELAATNLASGADGIAPTTAELVTGLSLFEASYGAGAVAIPGQTSNTAYDGIIAHAVANNRIALLAIANGTSTSAAVDKAEEYEAATGAEYAGFYHPWVKVPGTGGVTLTISPESFVAAKRAVAHETVGPWQAGAGLISASNYVTGLAVAISKATGDTLDAGRVNALRVIGNSVRVYGARSASSDEANYRYITYRDLLNYVVVESENQLEDLVFSPIDGRRTVFGRIEARLIGIVEPIRAAGGLFEGFNASGEQIDPGYAVQVTDALNPVAQLADGTVKARVGLRVSSVGDRIEVEILKSNLTSSVV